MHSCCYHQWNLHSLHSPETSTHLKGGYYFYDDDHHSCFGEAISSLRSASWAANGAGDGVDWQHGDAWPGSADGLH